MRIRVFFAVFLLIATTTYTFSEPLTVSMGHHGFLEMDVPSSWQSDVQGWDSPGGFAVVIRPPDAVPLVLLITPIPGPTDPDELAAVVQRTVSDVIHRMKEVAVEPELEVQELSGEGCRAFFVAATDKTVEEPSENEFRYADQGAAEVGKILITFTILTNVEDAEERATARNIIRSARHVPPTLTSAQEPSPTPGPDPASLRRAMEVLPEDGVVIGAPGEAPIVIRPGEQDVVALGGQLRFRHYFEGGVPGPAESASAIVTSAGPAFIPGEFGLVLRWVFGLEPRDSRSFLERVIRVSVEDVTGQDAIPIIDSAPQFKDGQLFVTSGEIQFSRESLPWMFTNDRTFFVFRITLDGDGSETLLQPVLVGPEVKQQVMDFLESNKSGD